MIALSNRELRELSIERLNHYGWANVCRWMRAILRPMPRIIVLQEKPAGRKRRVKP